MKPAKGRVVEFKTCDGQDCVGLVVAVWSDACINAAGWNGGGTAEFGSSLTLALDGAELQPGQWRFPPRV